MQEDEVSDDDKLVYDTEDDVYETAGAGSGAGALTLSSSQPVKNAAMINNVIGKIADALFEWFIFPPLLLRNIHKYVWRFC